MPYVVAAGVRVHFVEHGAPDASRALVLLHGFTPDHRLMTGAFEPVLGRARQLAAHLHGPARYGAYRVHWEQ